MTNPDEFYRELESFASVAKSERDKRERMTGCGELFFMTFMVVFLVGMGWAMYHLGRELHDFRCCEQTTTGIVISRQHDRKSYYDIAVCYTPAGGSEQVFVQRARGGERYLLGSTVRVRYREGQAFLDNSKENKHYNILWIGIILVFWGLLALVPGLALYRALVRKPRVLLRRWWRLRHHSPRP